MDGPFLLECDGMAYAFVHMMKPPEKELSDETMIFAFVLLAVICIAITIINHD